MKNLGSGSGTALYESLCWGGNADGLASPAEQVMGYVSCPTTSGQKMNQLLTALYCSYGQGLVFLVCFSLPVHYQVGEAVVGSALTVPCCRWPHCSTWDSSLVTYPWDAVSSVGTAKTATKSTKGSFPFK